MTHAPKFWAEKITTEEQKKIFWALVIDWGFTGETAYCRINAHTQGENKHADARANIAISEKSREQRSRMA